MNLEDSITFNRKINEINKIYSDIKEIFSEIDGKIKINCFEPVKKY